MSTVFCAPSPLVQIAALHQFLASVPQLAELPLTWSASWEHGITADAPHGHSAPAALAAQLAAALGVEVQLGYTFEHKGELLQSHRVAAILAGCSLSFNAFVSVIPEPTAVPA